MNTDWTSYSGIVNLSDPQVYTAVWQRIYRIFREEGVNNAIWIWNPNDKNFPPNNWNNFIHYFPGAEYMHLLGITGYNTGTYFYVEHGEHWREFDEIMAQIESDYMPFFAQFPWIMTEFASSSIGGDKVAWIDRMFNVIGNYPNLRAAVWFSAADYDPRPGFEGIPSRTYWLDETPETLAAFRRGVHGLRVRN
jgi:beta-mannanase